MPVNWLHKNEDGYSWTVVVYQIETAPSLEPNASKHAKQTWFFINLQPDGVCMNCRQRPGIFFPSSGSYSCEQCLKDCEQALAALRYR